MARYNSNGSLDPTFNSGGKVVTSIGSYALGYAVAIQSDQKILVAGISDPGTGLGFAVARYKTDGSQDPTFNGTGIVTTAVGTIPGTGNIPVCMALQSDGRIVVAGRTGSFGNEAFTVVRYNSDGSLDGSFNGTGILKRAPGSGSARGVAVQSDGKIVVAGSSGYSGTGTTNDFTVERYEAGPVTVPVVTTGAASSLTLTGASLTGTVDANGDNAPVVFQYGPTASYGFSATSTPSSVAANEPTAVNVTLTGLTPKTTYHYRVAATNSAGTGYGADASFLTLGRAPLAATDPPTSVAALNVTLKATVTPYDSTTSVAFEWGTTVSYGSTTSSQNLGANSNPTPVSRALSGLQPLTTYHYRVKATNADGTAYGLDQAFTTTGRLPIVATDSATSLGINGATLNGSVTPYDTPTQVVFEWGATTSYGNTTTVQNLSASSASAPLLAILTGLQPVMTYHFRIKATNSDGTTVGADRIFTTPGRAPLATSQGATGIAVDAATLNATVTPLDTTTQVFFEWGTTTSYGSSTMVQNYTGSASAASVSALLSGLAPVTTYHFRVKAANSDGTVVGADQAFTTLGRAPLATTGSVSGLMASGATLNASVTPLDTLTQVVFEWGPTVSYGMTTAVQNLTAGGSATAVSAALTGLLPQAAYHFRVKATNADGTAFGLDGSFTTLPVAPAVTSESAQGVTSTGATLRGSVTPNSAATTGYFQYGASTSYGTQTVEQTVGSGSTAVAVSALVSGLDPGTLYHYRFVATNPGGSTAGDDVAFFTPTGGGASAPGVATGTAAGIATDAVTLQGSVNPNTAATTAYFEYGTTLSYGSRTSDQNVGSGNSATGIAAAVGGLMPNALYHFRLVATNAQGTTNGLDSTFTTTPLVPVVTTGSASGVSFSAATLGGTVNPNGAATTGYFEYGMTTSYGSQTSTLNLGSGSAAGAASAPLSGLLPNTLYHFRLLATNGGGTSLGLDATFTTTGRPPSAATTGESALTATGARLNGTVTPLDSATDVVFEWGTTPSYGNLTAGQNLPAGAGAQSVFFNLTGLAPVTEYHYRVKATNADGTTFGMDQSFVTGSRAPVAATLPATDPVPSGATLNGTVTPLDTQTTVVFDWGLTPSYGNTTAPQSFTPSATEAAVSAGLTGLMPTTTYYYRVRATNAGGTTPGGAGTFVTAPPPPSATTNAPVGITTTTVTLRGMVNPNGAATTGYFEYGTTTAYGSATPEQDFGSAVASQAVTAEVSGLMADTPYHFRFIATSSSGMSVGADVNFSTSPLPPTVATNAATVLLPTGATLNGGVNPNGTETTAYFEHGLTTSYGMQTPVVNYGAGGASLNPSVAVSGLAANTLYHFRFVADNGGGTSVGADLTFTTSKLPPVVTTMAASGVGTTTATANGTVNANGLATTGNFEYGLTTSYGQSTATQDLGSGDTAGAVSAGLSGLAADTTYHYRLMATNTAGTTVGNDMVVRTNASGGGPTAPPSVMTSDVAGLTQTGATLPGTVNPNGGTTLAQFEYGLTNAYGSVTQAEGVGSGVIPISYSKTISGLQPGTTYHYRLIASNSLSQSPSAGADKVLSTPFAPPSATTDPAEEGTTFATLNGRVNPNRVSTAVLFSYDTSPGLTNAVTVPVQGTLTGASEQPVLVTLTGLVPQTTYYFRVTATSGAGTTQAAIENFTTLGAQVPLAMDDVVFTGGGNVSLNVIANDVNTDTGEVGVGLEFDVIVRQGAHGRASGGPVVNFDPNDAFPFEGDSFDYRVRTTAGLADVGTVSVLPFGAFKGSYGGTITGGTLTDGGLVTLELGPTGAFTGQLRWQNQKYALRDALESTGMRTITKHKTGAADGVDLMLTLQLDRTGLIFADLLDESSGTTLSFVLRRAAASTNATAGIYTATHAQSSGGLAEQALLGDGLGPQFVPGTGFTVGTVNKRATAGRLIGRVGDSEPYSGGSKFFEDRLALNSPLYPKGRGRTRTFGGSLTGDTQFNGGGTLTSVFEWIKQTGSAGLYPGGFRNGLQVTGDRFTGVGENPFVTILTLLGAQKARVEFADGDLDEVRVADVQFTLVFGGLRGRVLQGATMPGLSFKVNRKGVFSGAFTHPTTQAKTRYFGTFRKNLGQGRGNFRGSTTAGSVRVFKID